MKTLITLFLVMITSASAHAIRVKPGQDFPEYKMKGLNKAGFVDSKETKGKARLVDFWATWCEPCKKELPVLEGLSKKYKSKGFVIVGVNMDEDEQNAKDFIKKFGLTFSSGHDPEKKLASQLDLSKMPTSFLIDKKGKVKMIFEAFKEGDEVEMEKAIKGVL